MHPVHIEFVSRPVFCKLQDLFLLLDQIEVRKRHSLLGPVYQDLFRQLSISYPSGTDEEMAMEDVFRQFKDRANHLAAQSLQSFIICAIITTTLMWLFASSDESRTSEVIEHNNKELAIIKEQFANGKIPKGIFDRISGEIEERLNNLKSDVRLRKDDYEFFCLNVVAKLPKEYE